MTDIETDYESDQNIRFSRKRANPFCIVDSDVTEQNESRNEYSSDDYIDSEYYDEIIDKKKHKKLNKTRNPYIILEADTNENNMSDDTENSSNSNSNDNSFINNNENVISNMSDYLFHLQYMNKK